ncbi:hypothetical protein TPA0906_44550 [Streptomyces olivaceus]|nr:hypothetical protein TPA0906_44550 [Streptomyces olivaceus]
MVQGSLPDGCECDERSRRWLCGHGEAAEGPVGSRGTLVFAQLDVQVLEAAWGYGSGGSSGADGDASRTPVESLAAVTNGSGVCGISISV